MGRAAPIRDMRFLRRKPRATELMKEGRGELTDQSGRAKVTIDWKLNKIAKRDRVFKMTINGEEAYIDLEELMFYTRMIV